MRDLPVVVKRPMVLAGHLAPTYQSPSTCKGVSMLQAEVPTANVTYFPSAGQLPLLHRYCGTRQGRAFYRKSTV